MVAEAGRSLHEREKKRMRLFRDEKIW